MRTTFIALSCALALAACDDDSTPTDAGCTTCGTDSGTTGTDSGTPGTDSGTPGTDAGMDAGGGTDAGSDAGGGATDSGILGADAMVGADCTYNFDCAADQRCTCDEETGNCACEAGARGTLEVGEECEASTDCASGVCLEEDEQYCTRPCETEDDCGGIATECREDFFVGRACRVPE